MSNVNCITKNNTDYMYEDTAGRTLIGAAQDTSTTAIKAYVVGDLFWLNDLLYRVTADIASGDTITVGTNCVATTISAELEARVKTANIHHTYTSTDRNPISGEGVADALSSFSTTLNGLDDVDIDSTALAPNQVLAYNDTTQKWENQAASGGGHNMIPVHDSQTGLTDIEKIESLNNGNDDFVINAYSAKRWSNCDAKVVLTTVAQDAEGVGVWNDDWKTDGIRTGWLWSGDFYRILEDGNGNTVTDIEIIPVFDAGKSEVVSLYAYRIDDDVQNGGVNGGAVAFKFNGAVQNANGIKVGLKLVHQRTKVSNGTILT